MHLYSRRPKSFLFLAVAAASLFFGTVSSAHAEPKEHILKNLCSGPPADPLPPLRPNKPTAAEMTAKPRQHPYLFFDASSRQAMRDRGKAEPNRTFFERLIKHADDCLNRPIPAPVVAGTWLFFVAWTYPLCVDEGKQ